MIKVLVAFGTRPEAIKVVPVIKELQKFSNDFKTIVCVTAQHRQMLDQVLSLFSIKPDVDLNLMKHNQTLHSLSEKAIKLVSDTLLKIKPDIVLVQGDTTTAMIAALSAFYQKIPVGHIEAGLRTNDIYSPFPEEVNRRLITVLSTLNFAPTKTAAHFLQIEGIPKNRIFMTGNTIVDALQMMVKRPGESKMKLSTKSKKLILVTAHRRENFGKPLKNICLALKEIVKQNDDVEIIYPVHLNPNVKKVAYRELLDTKGITLMNPVEYDELVRILSNSYLVLTDSGGIQEEAPAFAKPVLVMREVTERPEGIKAGVAKLVGTDTSKIVKEANSLLNNRRAYEKMSKAVNPYGDGKSAKRIVRIIRKYFNDRK